MSRSHYRTVLPWVGLAAILAGYIVFIAWLHPIALFGISQDDSIFLTSAKAMVERRGYVLPSLPGAPPAANKFPVFYPWMLTWIWRLNPSFPANVNDAVALTVAFGLVYLTIAFIFFRRSMKIGDVGALLLTAFCAFQPAVLYHSACVLSDIPFAAFSLGAVVLADRAIDRNAHPRLGLACGVLAGLSILTRTTGYPIVLGILVIAVLRKAWRQAAVFGTTVAAFFGLFMWERASAAKAILPAGWSTLSPTFHQTWLYYTDYVGFRALSIVNAHVAGTILLNQVIYFCSYVPGFFITPGLGGNILLLFVLTVLVLWLIFDGFVRTINFAGWKPIHVAFLFYTALVMAWNYPDWKRFLIPFLPLLAASLWMEGEWIFGELSRKFHSDNRRVTRLAVLSLGLGLAALAAGTCWNAVTNGERSDLVALSRSREELLIEKKQAYEWLLQNSPSDARVVAGEDGCVYLYTGRTSMAYIAMLPTGGVEPEQLQSDLDHLTDVAATIKAKYWLGSVDDSDKQRKSAKPLLAARFNEIEGALPELFRSSSGRVHVYDLGCLQNPRDPSCQSADKILFPDGYSLAISKGSAIETGGGPTP